MSSPRAAAVPAAALSLAPLSLDTPPVARAAAPAASAASASDSKPNKSKLPTSVLELFYGPAAGDPIAFRSLWAAALCDGDDDLVHDAIAVTDAVTRLLARAPVLALTAPAATPDPAAPALAPELGSADAPLLVPAAADVALVANTHLSAADADAYAAAAERVAAARANAATDNPTAGAVPGSPDVAPAYPRVRCNADGTGPALFPAVLADALVAYVTATAAPGSTLADVAAAASAAAAAKDAAAAQDVFDAVATAVAGPFPVVSANPASAAAAGRWRWSSAFLWSLATHRALYDRPLTSGDCVVTRVALSGQARTLALLLRLPWSRPDAADRALRRTPLNAAVRAVQGPARRVPTAQRAHLDRMPHAYAWITTTTRERATEADRAAGAAVDEDGMVVRELLSPPPLTRPAFEWRVGDLGAGSSSGKKPKKSPEAPRSRLTDLFEAICVLALHGARLDIKDRTGTTPLDAVPANSLYRLARWALRLGLIKARVRAFTVARALQAALGAALGLCSTESSEQWAPPTEPGRVPIAAVRAGAGWAVAEDTRDKLAKRANGFRIGGISNNFNSAAKAAAKATEKPVTVRLAALAGAAPDPRKSSNSNSNSINGSNGPSASPRASPGRSASVASTGGTGTMTLLTTAASVASKAQRKEAKHARREGRNSDADCAGPAGGGGGGDGDGDEDAPERGRAGAALMPHGAMSGDAAEAAVAAVEDGWALAGDAGDMVTVVTRLVLSYAAQDKYEADSKLPSKLPSTMLQPLMGNL
mgnify:CR=1 FL=1